MRVLIQRITRGWVEVNGISSPQADAGVLALVGFHAQDGAALLEPMALKLVHLRIFDDTAGKMNRSLLDTGGDLVLVPQFTLHADTRKGKRPSFFEALAPQAAAPLFDEFVRRCATLVRRVIPGTFGASMQVHLVNDGPVTILLDSREER